MSLGGLVFKVQHLRQANEERCSNPSIRREWRTLSNPEKLAYIDAVKCLHQSPSRLRQNASSLDDFPWTHQHVGYVAHDSASFFSWHRYFVQIFEDTLRSACAYEGSLPYWDWTLDWQDPFSSPVFDTMTGFGGDGDRQQPSATGVGYCLTEGPLAGSTSRYWDMKEQLHCLARNLSAPSEANWRRNRPDLIERMLDHKDYFDFLLLVEHGPHNTVPNAIGGDFARFVAPAEPLFFLHHGQLDRMWWIWQQKSAKNRQAYSGPASSRSNATASLTDVLPLRGLARDPLVEEIIDTEKGLLCYKYDRTTFGSL
ncbi:hypothetical protein M409DRAFT_59258 [Zasmidium cellare ATCC 36951]|uniref:Tyrosinase copper-binding domain-containing protein n=1 Tax=Zasmidium cellare ATCC 36951 TaxID=1080233 RepID=A0A6A6C2M9_ZASCE|nr:uncharacterized protein M409DRAFT_59258 [Zasmidium cellare ATCC 36951]KAF2161255.1 hypothetical protein M409DRAFT_59258 [Zasmidium cellare ATCC 36951]